MNALAPLPAKRYEGVTVVLAIEERLAAQVAVTIRERRSTADASALVICIVFPFYRTTLRRGTKVTLPLSPVGRGWHRGWAPRAMTCNSIDVSIIRGNKGLGCVVSCHGGLTGNALRVANGIGNRKSIQRHSWRPWQRRLGSEWVRGWVRQAPCQEGAIRVPRGVRRCGGTLNRAVARLEGVRRAAPVANASAFHGYIFVHTTARKNPRILLTSLTASGRIAGVTASSLFRPRRPTPSGRGRRGFFVRLAKT